MRRRFETLLLLLLSSQQVWLAVGQSFGVSTGTITSPMGLGAGIGAWKPDVQLPIPEKTESSIYMAPYTVYKPKMQFHRKGFCVPRMAWTLQAAYAAECPPNTYLQTYFNGKQVCAVTRCAGPFGANKKQVDMGQVGKTGAAVFMQDAINKAGATYWGGDAGTVCNTVLLKPIMTCGDGCISDNRLYGDWCLCPDGYMPCPYNANNNGYTWCQCPGLGPPFGLCVADSYYCGYYCQYAPSWIFTAIAKGAMLCPIDPAQIDPYKPDIVFPGWEWNTNGGSLVGYTGKR